MFLFQVQRQKSEQHQKALYYLDNAIAVLEKIKIVIGGRNYQTNGFLNVAVPDNSRVLSKVSFGGKTTVISSQGLGAPPPGTRDAKIIGQIDTQIAALGKLKNDIAGSLQKTSRIDPKLLATVIPLSQQAIVTALNSEVQAGILEADFKLVKSVLLDIVSQMKQNMDKSYEGARNGLSDETDAHMAGFPTSQRKRFENNSEITYAREMVEKAFGEINGLFKNETPGWGQKAIKLLKEFDTGIAKFKKAMENYGKRTDLLFGLADVDMNWWDRYGGTINTAIFMAAFFAGFTGVVGKAIELTVFTTSGAEGVVEGIKKNDPEAISSGAVLIAALWLGRAGKLAERTSVAMDQPALKSILSGSASILGTSGQVAGLTLMADMSASIIGTLNQAVANGEITDEQLLSLVNNTIFLAVGSSAGLDKAPRQFKSDYNAFCKAIELDPKSPLGLFVASGLVREGKFEQFLEETGLKLKNPAVFSSEVLRRGDGLVAKIKQTNVGRLGTQGVIVNPAGAENFGKRLKRGKPGFFEISVESRTVPVRFGERYTLAQEVEALKKAHELDPQHFLEPTNIRYNDQGEVVAYDVKFVKGKTLEEYTDKGKGISPELEEKIRQCITKLHENGLAHGDLRAKCIIITDGGKDFVITSPVGFKPGFAKFEWAAAEDAARLDHVFEDLHNPTQRPPSGEITPGELDRFLNRKRIEVLVDAAAIKLREIKFEQMKQEIDGGRNYTHQEIGRMIKEAQREARQEIRKIEGSYEEILLVLEGRGIRIEPADVQPGFAKIISEHLDGGRFTIENLFLYGKSSERAAREMLYLACSDPGAYFSEAQTAELLKTANMGKAEFNHLVVDAFIRDNTMDFGRRQTWLSNTMQEVAENSNYSDVPRLLLAKARESGLLGLQSNIAEQIVSSGLTSKKTGSLPEPTRKALNEELVTLARTDPVAAQGMLSILICNERLPNGRKPQPIDPQVRNAIWESEIARYFSGLKGVERSDLFGSWRTYDPDVPRAENRMENYARQIYGQLEAVKSLEKSRPGATEFLYKNCGIRNFGRYDLRTLEHQYDVLTGRAPKSAKPVLTVFYPYSDYNGAFSKNLQAHLGPLAESFEIVIAEGKNAREMKQRLSEINSRYGQISVMFLGGHGTPKSIQLGGGSRLTAESFNDRELRGFFVEKPTMVLISCSTGKSRDWELFYKKPGSNYLSLPKINKDWLEKGIGRQISSDGWLVYAPEVPTNTESIFFSGKGTDGRYRFKVDWYAKGMEYVNGKLAGKTTGGARGKTSRVENTGPGFDISNKEPLYGQLGLELRRAGREYEIIESKYGAAIGKISEQRLGAFFEAATRYKLNFPDREIKANYFPSLNFALQEAYEKWSAKNQGKDLADYLMHLNKVKLPFELEAHEQEIRARLRENGFGEMKKGFIPVRHLGQNVVYSVETQKGAVFIKMQDMVEDAKIAIPLLEKLGRKLYKVHAYENFSIIEKFGNRISVRELQNSGQYGQMRADFLEPGGRYRQKFLESISSWVADMAVLGLWDVNPGNFLVSERGIVERIDFEEFGQRGFSSFKQLSDMLGISFDPVADAGAIPFMKKAFLERWEYLRQHFPEVSGELEGSIGRFMPRLTANQESETGRFYREREKNYGAETPRKIVKNMQNVLSDETGEQAWDRIFGMGKVR